MSKDTKQTENPLMKGGFLPTGYRVPDKSRQFMKLVPGDNQFRTLSPPLLGYVVFTEESGTTKSKPVRRSMELGPFTRQEMAEMNAKKDETGDFEAPRHFWLMLVWCRRENAPKILDVTQISIIKPLHALLEDKDWGDLRGFDLNINRVGTGKNDTEFNVIPKPHKPMEQEIIDIITELDAGGLLNLEAIWKGDYPFESYTW